MGGIGASSRIGQGEGVISTVIALQGRCVAGLAWAACGKHSRKLGKSGCSRGKVDCSAGLINPAPAQQQPQSAPRAPILGAMSVMHCPLCVGLAVLSVTRACAHLALGVLCWGRQAFSWSVAATSP